MTSRFCIVVPHYDHDRALIAFLPALTAVGLPVLVVDDGSAAESVARLEAALSRCAGTQLIRRARNGGKGAAMVTGLAAAERQGFTHAIGIDADGQHDARDVLRLRDEAAAHPDSIVSGAPLFGPDIPRSRLYGRMITTLLARLEAGSATIRDAMCGFRVYPLAPVRHVLASYRPRLRMDFDPEILVRACWHDIPIRYVPTRVVYPPAGVSHFRLFRDNAAMTWMHLRLLAGALLRLPRRVLRPSCPARERLHE